MRRIITYLSRGLRLTFYFIRSLLHVDADARMETYTDAEGNKRSNLSLIASKYYTFISYLVSVTNNSRELRCHFAPAR